MRALLTCILLACNLSYADTIDHFMKIADNIPNMEMKADPQAQAWARSARDVLNITTETIAETMILSNDEAKAQNHPIFCLPEGQQLSATILNNLIQQTYKELSSQQSDKNKMSVSQVAWLGVRKAYPCKQQTAKTNEMQHMSAMLGR